MSLLIDKMPELNMQEADESTLACSFLLCIISRRYVEKRKIENPPRAMAKDGSNWRVISNKISHH